MLDDLRSAMAREPLRVRLVAVVAVIVASHFGLHGDWIEPAADLAAVILASETARTKVTPAQPAPPAAGQPAKEQTTMNLEDFESAAKDALGKVIDAGKAFFAAHPEITSDAATALQGELSNVAELATAEVEQKAPAATQATLDAGIAAIQAEAESRVARVKADADAQVQALQSAKAAVAQ